MCYLRLFYNALVYFAWLNGDVIKLTYIYSTYVYHVNAVIYVADYMRVLLIKINKRSRLQPLNKLKCVTIEHFARSSSDEKRCLSRVLM